MKKSVKEILDKGREIAWERMRGRPKTEGDKRKFSLAKLGKPRAGNPKNWKHSKQTIERIRLTKLKNPQIQKRNEESIKFKHGLMNTGYKRINVEGKRVLEHRYVMEKYLQRKLLRTEYIHHRNGINTDNRLENLAVVVVGHHFTEINCPKCNHYFLIK